MITNLGHHGHMTWYILNIPDNIPSWDVMVASVWYILNVLNMGQFGMVLVLCPRPYNVLAMYQVSTSPLAPSVLGANARQGRGRSWLAGYPSLVLSHIHRVFYIYRFIFSTSMPSWGLTLAEDEGDPGLPGIPHPITSLLHWPRAGNQQAPTQPLDGASGYLSGPVIFPFISVRLMGSPMSGWHQTLVNKSATARLGQYALVFSP